MEKEYLKNFKKEPKLIEIKEAKKVIFVGDTHGDLEVSQKVVKDHLKKGNKIVFLGDYVDRGHYSRENLDFLLKTKLKHPEQVYLLQGNHEGHHIFEFFPAEFWESLSKKEYEKYSSIVEKFPLVVITNDIIALHGALPNLKWSRTVLDHSPNKPRSVLGTLGRLVNQIELGSEEWRQITWGDFSEEDGEYLGIDPFTGRPRFGKDYFLKLMKRFNKKVLIRSHQPDCPQFMFNDRCLTIFTSSAYTRERTIAVADLTKKIKSAKDLEIKKI